MARKKKQLELFFRPESDMPGFMLDLWQKEYITMAGEETAKKIDQEIIEIITKSPVPKTATELTVEDILRAQKYLDKNDSLQPDIPNADLLYQGAQRAQASQMDEARLMQEYARRGMNPNDLAGQLAAQQFGGFQRELNQAQEEALREFARRVAGETIKSEITDEEITGILYTTTFAEFLLAFYRSPYNDFKGFLRDYISSRVGQYRDSRNETKAEESRDSSQDETPRVILEEP